MNLVLRPVYSRDKSFIRYVVLFACVQQTHIGANAFIKSQLVGLTKFLNFTKTVAHTLLFRSSHFSFLVFGHFWRKYYVIFVYILQGKMGKTERKRKENHATEMTKIQKTKRRKYGMNIYYKLQLQHAISIKHFINLQ